MGTNVRSNNIQGAFWHVFPRMRVAAKGREPEKSVSLRFRMTPQNIVGAKAGVGATVMGWLARRRRCKAGRCIDLKKGCLQKVGREGRELENEGILKQNWVRLWVRGSGESAGIKEG